MNKNKLWTLSGLILILGVLTYEVMPSSSVDTRYSGAYALPDDSFIYISPEGSDVLRFRTLSGQSGLLWRADEQRFEGGKGFADREPPLHLFSFELDGTGNASALAWQQQGIDAIRAPRVPLAESIVSIETGKVRLRGKLVLPLGEGSHPAVVIVPGAESTSAVDLRFEPYLYASRGFAALVFDQRGTGQSAGEHTANLRVLATDLIAVVNWLRDQPGVDGANVHLVGFGEGGWVAPMAAARDAGIRSVLLNYGPLVSGFEDDRWAYVNALQRRGFDAAAIAAADRVNALISDIVDRGQDRWGALASALDEARSTRWGASLTAQDGMLGHFVRSRLPLALLRLEVWWQFGRHDPPYIDRLYDPVPTAAALKSPSFWIFGGLDSTMPTEWTLEALNKLQKRGKPVDYMVYPDSGHGILRVEPTADGQSRVLGYEPDYFKVQLDWLQRAAARPAS